VSLRKRNKLLWFLGLTPIILLLDQVFKGIFITGAICNKGFALGIGEVRFFIPLLLLIAVLFLIYLEKIRLNFIGLTLIFAGGVSNLSDRLIVGCVRDFISIFSFPSFNLADVAITLGVIFIAYSFVNARLRSKTNEI
jgi:signal peptidase II